METLPPRLEDKRQALSRLLGRPVVVRGVKTPDPDFRGRLQVDPDRVLIEYQVAQPGYFWEVPVIEHLLDRAAAGELRASVREAASSPPSEAPPEL